MGLKIRKRIKLQDGSVLNFSNSGISRTIKLPTGQHITYRPDGSYYISNNLGNGMYYDQVIRPPKPPKPKVEKKHVEEQSEILDAKDEPTKQIDPEKVYVVPDEPKPDLSLSEDVYMRRIRIYTDGGCCSYMDTMVGAWAYMIEEWNNEKQIYEEKTRRSEFVMGTSNNKMEVSAFIHALEDLQDIPDIKIEEDEVVVISDSKYLVMGFNSWLSGWIKNGWLNYNKKPVKNKDLWDKVIELKDAYKDLAVTWVKGHDTTAGNITVDAMCTKSIKSAIEILSKPKNKDKKD